MSTSIHSLRGQMFTPFYEFGGKCPHMQFLGRGQMYMLYTLIWGGGGGGGGGGGANVPFDLHTVFYIDIWRLKTS